MTQDPVQVERDGEVTVVTLSRPEVRNAVDPRTARRLSEVFMEFDKDPGAKVGVFQGAHGTFSAGADLKAAAAGDFEIQTLEPPLSRHRQPSPMGPGYLRLSKPVIAAVSGYAVAGGLELALWCDLRVVEQDAVLGVFSRRFGVPLIDGGTVRLPRIIGQGRALDLVLTGRPIGAEEALSMGLANRVVPSGRARAEAVALARTISGFPQVSLRTDRASMYEQWDLSFEEALVNESKRGALALRSREAATGAARFARGRGRGGRFDDT